MTVDADISSLQVYTTYMDNCKVMADNHFTLMPMVHFLIGKVFYNTANYTILYNTIQYYTILYNTIQYYTILYNTIQYYTILYNTNSTGNRSVPYA